MKLLYVLLLFAYMLALMIGKKKLKKELTNNELFFIDLGITLSPLVAIIIGALN